MEEVKENREGFELISLPNKDVEQSSPEQSTSTGQSGPEQSTSTGQSGVVNLAYTDETNFEGAKLS